VLINVGTHWSHHVELCWRHITLCQARTCCDNQYDVTRSRGASLGNGIRLILERHHCLTKRGRKLNPVLSSFDLRNCWRWRIIDRGGENVEGNTVDRRLIILRLSVGCRFQRLSKDDTMSSDIGTHHARLDIANHVMRVKGLRLKWWTTA